MDVGDWQEHSPLPIVPRARTRGRLLSPTLMGTLGTVLLHAMLIQSVSFGTRDAKIKPLGTLESAIAVSSSPSDADGLVLIYIPAMANENVAAAQNVVSSLPDLSKMKVKPQIDVDPPDWLSVETLALSEELASSTSASEAYGAEHARLLGIYAGQIQARIDRVWRRPRTAVNEDTTDAGGAESFQCEAQIVQDMKGNVQEILLPRCNGSAAWQRSLVLAIQEASPLPAPPSVTVFNNSISVRFVGLPYISGSSEDGYEIENTRIARE